MLDNEIKLFEEKLSEFLVERAGEFVLIYGKEVSFYGKEQDAVVAGLEKYGANNKFLVRQVIQSQPDAHLPAFSLGLINAHI